MKVLYLVSGIGPPTGWGTEFIQNLIFELSKKGVQATIINPIYKHTHPSWGKWTKEQHEKFGVQFINITVPLLIQRSFLLNLTLTPILVTLEAIKLLSKEEFSVIHEFSSTPSILIRSLLFKFFFSTKTIFTLSVYNNTLLGKLFWFKVFDLASFYLIPSRKIQKRLIENGINSRKVIFSPPGINTDVFKTKVNKKSAREKLNLPNRKFIVSYFGSLTTEKGVKDLIEAAGNLSRQIRENILIVFAAVWKASREHQPIKKKLQALNYHHVKLIEKYVDIPILLCASDAVVLPQHTGHGATIPPVSIIETLLNKTYIITTATIGVDEWVNKKNGTLLPSPGNIQELTRQIVHTFQERKLNMTTDTELKVLADTFDINRSVKLHLKVYTATSLASQ